MIRISWMLVSCLAAAIVILAGPDQPEQAIDTERSFLTVHVGKTGVLSAAAHEHWVNAPIAGGTVAADGSTPRLHQIQGAFAMPQATFGRRPTRVGMENDDFHGRKAGELVVRHVRRRRDDDAAVGQVAADMKSWLV